MLLSRSIVSGLIVTAFSATVAGTITFATSESSPLSASDVATSVNRVAKTDRALPMDRKLQSALFSASPFEDAALIMMRPQFSDREKTVEELPVGRTKDAPRTQPAMNGCDSGLSPDISPTTPLPPGRCVADAGGLPKLAAIKG